MKRFLAILLFLGIVNPVLGQTVVLTGETTLNSVGDSFFHSQYANRWEWVYNSYFIMFYPEYMVRVRMHGRSGANNVGYNNPVILATGISQFSMYCIPDAYDTGGTKDYWTIFNTSDNGGSDSNTVRSGSVDTYKFPAQTYNQSIQLSNDWPFSISKFHFVQIGDPPYYSAGGNSTYLYEGGGRTAAAEAGWQFISLWSSLTNFWSNYNGGYPANSNLYWPQAQDHYANTLHGVEALCVLTNEAVATNCFTLVADWSSSSGWTTNNISAASISQSGNSLSFTVTAAKSGPAIVAPDGTTTNDMREVLTYFPNQFHEDFRVVNLPAGIYTITIDGTYANVVSSTQLASGYNWWMNFNNPWHDQQMQVWYAMCDMRNISRVNNSDANGSQALLDKAESDEAAAWRTSVSVAGFVSNSSVAADQVLLKAQDTVIHGLAQQTSHTVVITLDTAFIPAPFR